MKLKVMLRNMEAINKVNIKYGGKKKNFDEFTEERNEWGFSDGYKTELMKWKIYRLIISFLLYSFISFAFFSHFQDRH